MKLVNKTGNGLSHSIYEDNKREFYYLANGETKDIPEAIAEIWLKMPGVEQYIDQEELERAEKAAKAKAEAEKKALEEQNKALQAQLEALKQDKTEEKKPAAKKQAAKKKK